MEKRKRLIAIFLPSLRGGGAERVMLDLANGLINYGFQVDLLLSKSEGPYLEDVRKDIRIIDFSSDTVVRSIPKLVRYLRSEKPSIFLSTMSYSNIAALTAHKLSFIKTKMIIREANTLKNNIENSTHLKSKLIPYFMKLTYPLTDVVITVSQGVKDDLLKNIPIDKNKVQVIYNPVNIEYLAEKSKCSIDHPWFDDNNIPVILGVGRLTKQKNYESLITAFSNVRKKMTLRLMIIGEGDQRNNLEILVKRLGLENDVLLPGFIKNPFPYMARSSLFVLSSMWEGFPNVLLQAMALGTPVVATDCPSGPAEILDNGKIGKLVSPGDIEALADAMLQSLETDQWREIFINQANKFGFDSIIKEYIKTFNM